MGHFLSTLGMALAFSAGLAIYDRKTRHERLYRGAYVFAAFLLTIFGGGWLMYLINP